MRSSDTARERSQGGMRGEKRVVVRTDEVQDVPMRCVVVERQWWCCSPIDRAGRWRWIKKSLLKEQSPHKAQDAMIADSGSGEL